MIAGIKDATTVRKIPVEAATVIVIAFYSVCVFKVTIP